MKALFKIQKYKIQKIIIRIIGNIRARNSTQLEFKRLKILRLPDIFQYSISIFMYKYTNNLLPDRFHNYFYYNRDIHTHNTRSQDNIRQPKVKTKIAESFVTNMGPKLWNSLDENTKKIATIASFKKQLLNLIIAKYG